MKGKRVLKVLGELITWSSQAFAVTFRAFVHLNEVVWTYGEIHKDLTRRVWCRNTISIAKRFVCLTLQGVITRINNKTNCHLLNYLILIAKLYLWGCKRNQTLSSITALSSKVKIRYETEKSIRVKTNKMDKFNKKWALPLWCICNVLYCNIIKMPCNVGFVKLWGI